MPTVIFQHNVSDRAHWLASGLREREFSRFGVTNIRTFIDPSAENRCAISVDVPDLEPFLGWLQSAEGAAAAEEDGVDLTSMVMLVESGG